MTAHSIKVLLGTPLMRTAFVMDEANITSPSFSIPPTTLCYTELQSLQNIESAVDFVNVVILVKYK